jgi:N,N-dimethylformamidase beta subunit-like, C-terminal
VPCAREASVKARWASRRRLAAAFALLVLSALVLAGRGLAGAALSQIARENRLHGDRSWTATYATGGAIEGYTSEVSVLPGGIVHLHVSTALGVRYRIRVLRLGWYHGLGDRLLWCQPSCRGDEAGRPQLPPAIDPVTGEVRAEWPITNVIRVPASTTSGYYFAQLVLTSGSQAGNVQDVPFVVRPRPEDVSRVLVQVPVTTWEAYNPWGGSCVYRHPVCGRRAVNVSFDRPYGWESPLQNPLHWELPLIHFLERYGVDLSYQTDADTDADPSSLLAHRLVISAGHSEYWTKTMFDAFDAARDAGTNLAFMGANNVYWQTRYELNHRRIVVYKNSPDPEPDPALKTIRFSELQPPRYECELTGVQHLGGAFNHHVDDYMVNPDAINDPWFRNTGFSVGSVVRQIVSGERDDLPPNQAPGEACGHPMTLLFEHPDSGTDNLDAAKAIRYVAASGARVFATGSHEFADGLDPLSEPTLADPRLERFMLNALDDLKRPAAPQIVATTLPHGLGLTVSEPGNDPRITRITVTRIGPTGTILLHTCNGNRCFDRPPPGSYRYQTTAYDRWGHSYPATTPTIQRP